MELLRTIYNYFILRNLLFFVSLCLCGNYVSAQDTLKIKEVNIYGSKKDTSKHDFNKVDSALVNNFKFSSIDNLLKNMSSLSLRNYGNGSMSTVSIRGAGASHTKVLWNEMSLNSPMSGQTDLSQVPVFLTENVSLNSDAQSLSLSAGGLGGIIAFENSPDWGRNKVSFSQEVASFNSYGSYLNCNISDNKINEKLKLYYKSSLNDFTYYNYAILPAQQMKLQNSKSQQIGLMNEFYYKINNANMLSLFAWISSSNRDIPPIMTNVESAKYNENQNDKNFRALINYNKELKKGSFNYKLGSSFSEIDYYLAQANSISYQTNIKSNELFSKISVDYKLFNYFDFNANNITNYQNGVYIDKINENNFTASKLESSIYLNVSKDFFKKFNLRIATRELFSSNNEIAHCPLFAINYYYNNKKTSGLEFSASNNVKQPSMNDLYFIPGGNVNLKPEQSKNFNLFSFLNYSKNKVNVHFKGGLFYNYIQNWIMWKPSSYGFWTAENVSNVISEGLENSLSFSVKFKLLSFGLLSNYSHVNSFSNNSADKNQLIYIPKNTFNSTLNLKIKNLAINYSVHYESKRSISLSSESPKFLESFVLNDIALKFNSKIKALEYEIKLAVNNVFNYEYQLVAWRPMAGRNFSIILTMTL